MLLIYKYIVIHVYIYIYIYTHYRSVIQVCMRYTSIHVLYKYVVIQLYNYNNNNNTNCYRCSIIITNMILYKYIVIQVSGERALDLRAAGGAGRPGGIKQ